MGFDHPGTGRGSLGSSSRRFDFQGRLNSKGNAAQAALVDVVMPTKAPPTFSYTALDGTVLGLRESRFDERQRRQRHCLKKDATYWDYAPLLDVVRQEPGFGTHRFTGKSAAEWVADLRERKSPELDRFTQWYEALVGHFQEELAKRPRFPDNLYSIELARPPLTSSLPSLIRGLGLKRASAEQWAASSGKYRSLKRSPTG